MLPFSVQQLVERGGESEGIFAYQLVGTDAPGFGMLGIGIEGDAGDVEEGSFFGDVSRVGDDAPCLVDEESEVQVTLRRQDVQVGSIHFQRLHRLLHVGV